MSEPTEPNKPTMSEPVTGFADDVDEQAIVDEFLSFLPERMAQYSRSCIVFNPSTGRYDIPVDDESTTDANAVDNNGTDSTLDEAPSNNRTPYTATPAEGQRAPPPTPASITAALENGHGSLKPVPEDNSIELAAPSRPASPGKVSSESGSDQGTEKIDEDITGSTEVAEIKPREHTDAAASETRVISPITATIKAFDTLSAKNGNKGLEASKFAKPGVLPRVSNSSRPRNSALASRDPNTDSVKIESTKPATLIIPEARKSSETYQDRVVESFRKEHQATNTEGGRSVKFEKAVGSPAPEQAPVATDTTKSSGLHAEAADAVTVTSTALPATEVDTPADTTTAADGEDRQDATYFASWGAPDARSGPKAEVRRVLLKGLPAVADNAFVAALIHGGAVESYRLVKAGDSAIITAVVTFTTGAAAKAYYDKYPNGLDIKFLGKKYVAMVDLGDNVDVVSGVLRGYLETGATRVVRAVGADEDWAMRALRKIAEEKGRKVEAIVDTFKDEGRTIEFRFTNIADAVAFRGSLMRDPDWADCTLQFGEDPCEKASAVRKV